MSGDHLLCHGNEVLSTLSTSAEHNGRDCCRICIFNHVASPQEQQGSVHIFLWFM